MNEPEDRQPEESQPQGTAVLNCPACGAVNNAFATKCWICQAPFGEQERCDESAAGKKPEFARGVGSIFSNMLLGVLLLALIVVGIGVFRINAGWLVYYVAFISLPLVAIAIGLRQALVSSNQNVRAAGAILTSIYVTFLTIVGTAVVVIASIVALIVSFFVALGQACSDILNAGN